MGILDKVKNFFYDDEYPDDDDEEVKVKKSTSNHRERENVNYKESRMEKEKKEEITERELFKAEKTFNFPMDLDDTIFGQPVKEKSEKKEVQEKKQSVNVPTYRTVKTSYEHPKSYFTKEEKKEEKKFMPTPVISPIYGVLDKNYKKEDVAIDNASDFSSTRKLDYDSVMKRAMKKREAIEEEEENKSIFFNLDEDNNKDDDIKIIYNDVSSSEENQSRLSKNSMKSLEEDNILSDTKEQDLFNLIDNMYSAEDDEEDEE